MANQREADIARRDKRKGMEFDLMLSDRAAGQDRRTKTDVATIRAEGTLETARLKAQQKRDAETYLTSPIGKEMSKVFAATVSEARSGGRENPIRYAITQMQAQNFEEGAVEEFLDSMRIIQEVDAASGPTDNKTDKFNQIDIGN